jgi:conjugative transfer signal peptidase TraF
MKPTIKITIATICCFAVLLEAAIIAGIRVNSTSSYPVGIYLLTNTPIEKGSLVIFCPENNSALRQARERGYISAGFCPEGYGYMIKKILAAKNDKVEISPLGVFVNDKLLPNSKSMATDFEGQSLPHLEYNIAALPDNSVLLMSDYNHKSFDARYFGVIDKSNIISAIRPIWTW